MKMEIWYGNLLEVEQGFYLAHCISGDFSLGAGLAKAIDEAYAMREKLHIYYLIQEKPCALLVDNVFNLVTKAEIKDRPTCDTLKQALSSMKDQMEFLHVRKLAIPKLGCGRDGLDWDKVETLIKEIFEDYHEELEIRVVEFS